MPKYSIKWGIRGGPQSIEIIEAASEQEATRMADELAEDLWESNKIATAKPIRDKDDEKPTGDTVSGRGVVSDVHAAGRSAGGGE